jgi:hypothetical protein
MWGFFMENIRPLHPICMNKLVFKNILFAPSLIGCLILVTLLFSIDQLSKFRKEARVITQFLPSEKKTHPFYAGRTLKKYEEKKELIFILNGDDWDTHRIARIQFSALQLRNSCDTNTVIKVSLHENASYQSVIKLLDFMQTGKYRRYMFHDNYFYIFPPDAGECMLRAKPQA